VSQPILRGRSGMKYHRLSRWDSVTQTNLRGRSGMKYHRRQSVGFCDATYVRGRSGMKDHRLSRWDSVSQPNLLSAFQACTSFLERFPGLRASRSPLATICRACGAHPWLPTAAPAALTPGYQLPRLRRSPLATNCRACGARPWLPTAAPAAL
jgi:hypothetical protein